MSYAKGGFSNAHSDVTPKGVIGSGASAVSDDSAFDPPKIDQTTTAQAPNQATSGTAGEPSVTTEVQAQVPGLDLFDGLMSLVLAPGRALVSVVTPNPGPKELPLVILISAGTWWAAWWAFNKYVLKNSSSSVENSRRRFRKRVKKAVKPLTAIEDSDDDVDDDGDEE